MNYTSSGLPPLPEMLLRKVDIRAALDQRPSRPPNYEADNRSLLQLADEMTRNHQNVLQTLAEIAMERCQSGSAGVSLLENQNGQLVFRWAALAGAYTMHRNGFMARNASPCGVTVDRNTIQLMSLPERVFPMRPDPRIYEALLIPFHLDDKPIGTVWVVTHDEQRKFDAEDARVVGILAKFASAAWMLWKMQVMGEEIARRHWEELTAANEMLQTKVQLLTDTLKEGTRL